MGELYIQFVGTPGIYSKAIRWFTAGTVSHVDAVLPSGRLLGSRADKVGGANRGVHIRAADYEPFNPRVLFRVETEQEKVSSYWDFLFGQLGKPYDKPAILGFGFGRNWREDDSWFCSELIARALEVSHVLPELFAPANKITPQNLATALSASGALWTTLYPLKEAA